MNTRILVATDGEEGAVGALRLARALSGRERRTVELLGVVAPFALQDFGSAYSTSAAAQTLEQQQVRVLRVGIVRQLIALGEEPFHWPIRLEVGAPAPTIARVAADAGAAMILLGIGRHAALDRWLGTETALSVVRLAHVPVLAVQPRATELPHTVLVAVDFSAFSRPAAYAALEIVAAGAEVHLAHVAWPTPHSAEARNLSDWMQRYRERAQIQLEELGRELESRGPVRVHTRVLTGGPARRLLEVAEEIGAELIAAGSHGLGFFGRLVLGSVSACLLRGARCSVLIAPPQAIPSELRDASREGRRGRDRPFRMRITSSRRVR